MRTVLGLIKDIVWNKAWSKVSRNNCTSKIYMGINLNDISILIAQFKNNVINYNNINTNYENKINQNK